MSIPTIQVLSISTALIASGGIATLTLFDVPLLKSQPASRSLPTTRWLFSRGSHIFPTAAFISSGGFSYLAYQSLPHGSTSSLATILQHATKGKPGLYLLAAALSISIAPVTTGLMLPTNFALIRMNEEKGGSRSAASASFREKSGASVRSAEESTDSKNDVSQWKDLSGPQERTIKETTKEEDEEVRRLLDIFAKLNMGRAVLIGAGGVVGLLAALL
jgi:hypothetical protein